jgi:hypothetical protein
MDISIPFYSPQRIKVFLSYSTIDKNAAGVIKFQLESFGYDVFLAHHDLQPSQIWIEEIIKNINECDVFLPFLTENSFNSFWVNQEIGIGFIKKKLIIPFKINLNPWGFISQIQAYSLDATDGTHLYNDIKNACLKIEKIITNKMPEKMIDTQIFALSDSGSYETSNKIAKSLSTHANLSADQINEILRISLINTQVSPAYDAKVLISKLIANNQNIIDENLLKWID